MIGQVLMLVYLHAINHTNPACHSKKGIVALLLWLLRACLKIPDHTLSNSGTNSKYLRSLCLQANADKLTYSRYCRFVISATLGMAEAP